MQSLVEIRVEGNTDDCQVFRAGILVEIVTLYNDRDERNRGQSVCNLRV